MNIEIKKAIESIELRDKDHLIKWLIESDRKWLVFNSIDLVRALLFPEGVRMFQTILNSYREFRSEKSTGYFRKEKNPIDGTICDVEVFHDEVLSNVEIDEVIYFLNTQRVKEK